MLTNNFTSISMVLDTQRTQHDFWWLTHNTPQHDSTPAMASLGYIMIYLLVSSLESKTHDQAQCRLAALLPRTGYPPNISCTRLIASDSFHHSCIHVSPQANHIQSRKPSGQNIHSWTFTIKSCEIFCNHSFGCNNTCTHAFCQANLKFHFQMFQNIHYHEISLLHAMTWNIFQYT